MEIFNADQERNIEINNLLQEIKYKVIARKTKAPIFVEFYVNSHMKYKIIILLNNLKKMGAIKFDERNWDETNKTLEKNRKQTKATIIEGYWVEPIEPKFSQLCEEYTIKVKKHEDNQSPQKKQIKPEVLKNLDDLSNAEENDKGKIKKIEIVKHEHNTGKIKVIINEDYQSPLEVKLGRYWSELYKLAEKQQILFRKTVFDYFNSNLQNPLYANLGYKQTQIMKSDNAACIIPAISIEIISNKKFKTRKNKTT